MIFLKKKKKKKAQSSSESPLKPFYKLACVTQISKKQQCLTVCAVNGLKKEQLALTDGAEEPRRALEHHLQQEPVKHEAPPKLSPAAAVISHIHRFEELHTAGWFHENCLPPSALKL